MTLPPAAVTGRIGILGGTFNPVHHGHLIVAEEARRKLRLDRILFIPSAQPPHKHRRVLPFKHRLAMLRAAVRGNAAFMVSDMENHRRGPSYTIDTIRLIRQLSPGPLSLYFLLGADNLPDLSLWKEPEELVRACRVVLLTRPGFDDRLPRTGWQRRIRLQEVSRIDISSTQIRKLAAQGMPVRYLVPDAVDRYIIRHRLYRNGKAGT